MSIEDYKSEAAREARKAAANVRRIVHEFGDPSSEDYRNPFENPFEYPTYLVEPRGARPEAGTNLSIVDSMPMQRGQVYEI